MGAWRRAAIAVFCVAALDFPRFASAEWFADVEAGMLYDSNLGNSRLKQDIKSDTAFTLSTSAGQFAPLGEGGGLTVAADLKSESYRNFPGMSNLSLGGTLAYRKKFGLGDEAPWLRLSASKARLQFHDDVRNGWLVQAATDAGQTINDRWRLHAQYRYERRTADHAVPADPDRSGAVFDQKGHSVTLDSRLSLDSRNLLSASYTRRQGDVASTTSSDDGRIDAAATAETADPAFGPGASAYRLRAVVHSLAIGFSRAMSGSSALNLSCERVIARGAGGNDYYNNIGSITFLYSF